MDLREASRSRLNEWCSCACAISVIITAYASSRNSNFSLSRSCGWLVEFCWGGSQKNTSKKAVFSLLFSCWVTADTFGVSCYKPGNLLSLVVRRKHLHDWIYFWLKPTKLNIVWIWTNNSNGVKMERWLRNRREILERPGRWGQAATRTPSLSFSRVPICRLWPNLPLKFWQHMQKSL